MIKSWFKNIGPGPLVAAAFIGPGTVTLCSIAGVNFGYALLWAMVLSILATIVLQEMAARLGIVSQKGLSEIIRSEIKNPVLRGFAIILILSAIVIGNAAYEAGNISGGALGMQTLFGNPIIELGSLKLKESINTVTPSRLIGVSSSAMLSSKENPYWNPEQPPPVTKTLSLSSSLSSSAFKLCTLATARSVTSNAVGVYV